MLPLPAVLGLSIVWLTGLDLCLQAKVFPEHWGKLEAASTENRVKYF